MKLLKGKRLKSVALAGDQPCIYLLGVLSGLTGQHQFWLLDKGKGNVASLDVFIALDRIQQLGLRNSACLYGRVVKPRNVLRMLA